VSGVSSKEVFVGLLNPHFRLLKTVGHLIFFLFLSAYNCTMFITNKLNLMLQVGYWYLYFVVAVVFQLWNQSWAPSANI